ncbi:MAG: cob(I)yrinic acid a,c-diamide adenosyltransferase [Akkermansiaceae bacterium]
MSIITKRGDEGETDLLFGRRIRKTSLRVQALGAIDELNAALGLARAAGLRKEIEEIIDRVQEKLVAAMGQLATLPEDYDRYTYAAIGAGDVAWLEQMAKDMESRGVRFTDWARPGAEGAIASAALDMARTVARRAERQSWELHEQGGEVSADVLLFLNRISDMMWILARVSA